MANPLIGGSPADSKDKLFDIALAYAQSKRLSSRECEVFTRFVSQGKTSKEIAAELGIAYPTVKLYWTRIYRKLGCEDAVGALVAFMREVTLSIPGELFMFQPPTS
jgi:DNA-binding NarL/FixJ family response regulator